LLARDNSIERVWLLRSWSWVGPSPSKVSRYVVEATAPIHNSTGMTTRSTRSLELLIEEF
jgi:hypothetical protein